MLCGSNAYFRHAVRPLGRVCGEVGQAADAGFAGSNHRQLQGLQFSEDLGHRVVDQLVPNERSGVRVQGAFDQAYHPGLLA